MASEGTTGGAFGHRDLHRIARVAQALASGAVIELPETEQRRGHRMTEAFRLGPDRVEGTPCLQARTTFRRERDGRTVAGLWDALDWSVSDLVAMTAWWPAETLDALPEPDAAAPPVAALLRLDATGVATIAGRRYSVWARVATEAEPWAIEVPTPDGDGKWGADELIGMGARP